MDKTHHALLAFINADEENTEALVVKDRHYMGSPSSMSYRTYWRAPTMFDIGAVYTLPRYKQFAVSEQYFRSELKDAAMMYRLEANKHDKAFRHFVLFA